MLRSILCFVMGALISGTSQSAERPCPATTTNSAECAAFIEAALLQRQPSLVRKEGNILFVTLRDKNQKRYASVDYSDELNNVSEAVSYHAIDYYPEIDYLLLSVTYYEGETFLLVNLKNGAENDMLSPPVLSPDNKRIAAGNFDYSGITSSGLSVFRLSRNGLVREFHEEDPKTWVGADQLRWTANDELLFIEYRYDATLEGNNEPPFRPTPRKLEYLGWRRPAPNWRLE